VRAPLGLDTGDGSKRKLDFYFSGRARDGVNSVKFSNAARVPRRGIAGSRALAGFRS